jgi:hypothetical protein
MPSGSVHTNRLVIIPWRCSKMRSLFGLEHPAVYAMIWHASLSSCSIAGSSDGIDVWLV